MSTVPRRPAFSSFPLAALAAAFATGVALARFAAPPLAACVVCGVLLFAFSVFTLYREKPALASTTLLSAFVFAGGAVALAELKGVAENRVRRFYERGEFVSGDPVELTGVL